MPGLIPIPGDSDDARAVRTRDALASALIALMDGRDYDAISVQHICDRAQVGRSTFYAHFQDKDEMYIRHVVVFARRMAEQLGWDRGAFRFPVAHLFDHIRQMRPMIESLRKAGKTEFIMKLWQNNLAEVFEQRVLVIRAGAAAEVPAPIMAQQLAGTFITLVTWWLDHHYPHSAPDMEAQWNQLVKSLR
jgi:AcrR family transcriptional regulator